MTASEISIIVGCTIGVVLLLLLVISLLYWRYRVYLRQQQYLKTQYAVPSARLAVKSLQLTIQEEKVDDVTGITRETSHILVAGLLHQLLQKPNEIASDLHQLPTRKPPFDPIARQRTLSNVVKDEVLECINTVYEGDDTAEPQFAANPMFAMPLEPNQQITTVRNARVSNIERKHMSMRMRERYAERCVTPQLQHSIMKLKQLLPASVIQEAIQLAINVSGAASLRDEDMQPHKEETTTDVNEDAANGTIATMEVVLHAALVAAARMSKRYNTPLTTESRARANDDSDIQHEIDVFASMRAAAETAKAAMAKPPALQRRASFARTISFCVYVYMLITCQLRYRK